MTSRLRLEWARLQNRVATLGARLDVGWTDLKALVQLAFYAALATAVVAWGAGMYLLVKAIVT